MFANSGEHARTDFLVVVECEHEIRPVRSFERPMRPRLSFDSPPDPEKRRKEPGVLLQPASCSRSLESDVHEFRRGFAVFQTFCDHAERERLNARNRFVPVRAVAHHAGQRGHLSHPAAIVLTFKFDGESHAFNVPPGSAVEQAALPDPFGISRCEKTCATTTC